MPLSARSPDGVVSLVGMDQQTLEHLKRRNRKDRLFVSKCCGEPVQIRTPAGKVPHFYHLNTATSCEGSKGETPTHLALKAQIAEAALAAGWEVEVEAEERNQAGKLVWKADVLARRRSARVAFEVQISNQDWSAMEERQERYARSRVRGMWFVKTTKPYPVQKALPIFSLRQNQDLDWRVSLRHPDEREWETEWAQAWGECGLTQFITKVLNRDLQWAPLARMPEAECSVSARLYANGTCLSCGRHLGVIHALEIEVLGEPAMPPFGWHQGMTLRRSEWPVHLVQAFKTAGPDHPSIAVIDGNKCSACGARADSRGHGFFSGVLKRSIRIRDLPPPSRGTIEWGWIHRWVLMNRLGTQTTMELNGSSCA